MPPPITKKDMFKMLGALQRDLGQLRMALAERDTHIQKLTDSHNNLANLHNGLRDAVNNLPNNARFVDALLGRMAIAFQQGQKTMTDVDAKLMLDHAIVVQYPENLNWARQVSYEDVLEPAEEGKEPTTKRVLHVYKGTAAEDGQITWVEEEEVDAIRYRMYEMVIERDAIPPGTNTIVEVKLPNGGAEVAVNPDLPVTADINQVSEQLAAAATEQAQEIAAVAPEAVFNTIISETPFEEPALKANQFKLTYTMAPERGPDAMNVVAKIENDGGWIVVDIDPELGLHYATAMRNAGVPEGSARYVAHG